MDNSVEQSAFHSAVGSTNKLPVEKKHPVSILRHGERAEFQGNNVLEAPSPVEDGLRQPSMDEEYHAAWVPRFLPDLCRIHLRTGDIVYAAAAPRKGVKGTYWWLARIVDICDCEESKRSFSIRYVCREKVKNLRYRNYKRKPEWVSLGDLMLYSKAAETKAKLENAEYEKQLRMAARSSKRISRGKNSAKIGSKKDD